MENIFGSFNVTSNTVRSASQTDLMEFTGMAQFQGKRVFVDGFFFTEGKYGKQVVVVGNGYKINMPARCVEVFEKIAANEKMMQKVLDGYLVLDNIKSANTKNGTTTIFDYIESTVPHGVAAPAGTDNVDLPFEE